MGLDFSFGFGLVLVLVLALALVLFFSRPSPKAGRELQIDRMDEGGREAGMRDP